MGLTIDEDRLGEVLKELPTEYDDIGRHATFTRQKYETIYGITPETINEQLDRVFSITVRQRSGSISLDRVNAARDTFDIDAFRDAAKHEDAHDLLTGVPDVGPKIANEFLRKVVHTFGFRPEWTRYLHVPLDKHVTEALVDTGCILEEDGSRTDRRSPGRVFNFNSESNPRTRLVAGDLQDAFKRVAEEQGTHGIAFDELWSENKFYLSVPEFRDESCLARFLTK